MGYRKKRNFYGTDYLKEGSMESGGSSGGGGGGGNVPPSFLKMVNNHINDKKKHPGIIKDMVFGLSSPFKEGPQYETEIIFPHKSGVIERIDVVVSSESEFKSNLIIGIEQMNESKNYDTLAKVDIGIGVYKYSVDVNKPILNNIVRLNLIDGDYSQIKSLQFVMVIKDVVKHKY